MTPPPLRGAPGRAEPPRRDLVDVVLGVHGPPSRRHRLAGAGAGLAAGAGALLALWVSPPASRSLPRPSPHLEISLEEPAELIPPPLPPAPLAASPTSSRPLARRATARPAARAVSAEPAPAARVLAREPRADEPVDLTGAVFVAGTAPAPPYPGGTLSATGTSASAGAGRAARGQPASATSDSPGGGPSDRSRPVSLPSDRWSCPWPSEAEPLSIDAQTVVIRVIARSDGTVEAVTVLSDPGHGFGEAASSCARRARFLPARASNGQAVRAPSPPILVRFSR